MSEENVKIVRQVLEVQFGSGAAFDLGVIADDFEWIWREHRSKEDRSGVGVRSGSNSLRLWTQDFVHFSFQVVRLMDAGDDRGRVALHQSATGKGRAASRSSGITAWSSESGGD